MPSEMRAIRSRLDFSKIPTSIQIPNLIEVQRRSYERFLQMDKLPQEREDNGLQSVFTSVFPISDFRNVSELEFVDFSIGNWECKCGYLKGLNHLRTACTNCGHMVITDPFHPGDVLCHFCGTYNKNTPDFCTKCGDPVGLQLKYDQAECEERGMTYSAPLKVTIRLKIYDKDPETGQKTLRDMKEQEVFFGDIPLMSQNGTFIVNGTERVIVSQLHRSPGVFFETANNRTYFLGKIIPYRGSWVEFEYDQKNTLYVRIDRKRKFLGTIFLRALGLRTDEEILKTFYTVDTIQVRDQSLFWNVAAEGTPTNLLGTRPASAVTAGGEELVPAGRKISPSSLRNLRGKVEFLHVETSEFDGAMTASDVVDMATGELLYEANQELTADKLHKIAQSGVTSFEIFFPEKDDVGNIITNTLRRDSVRKPEEALIEIYRKLRPGDPPTLDTATALFEGMFFDPRKYDFSRVGRLKFNIKLYEDQSAAGLDKRTLTPEDFYGTIRYLLKLRKNIGVVDDIDHLGNRRVRAVGELMENQFRIGLVRMERAIKEKMSVYQEMSTAMPHDLINAKPVMAAIREFFGSSQLSQFMDQTNPCRRLRTSVASPPLGLAVCPASAPALKSATCTLPTTAVSARSKRRKARTSASSRRSPASRASMNTASSSRPTVASRTVACSTSSPSPTPANPVCGKAITSKWKSRAPRTPILPSPVSALWSSSPFPSTCPPGKKIGTPSRRPTSTSTTSSTSSKIWSTPVAPATSSSSPKARSITSTSAPSSSSRSPPRSFRSSSMTTPTAL